MHKGISQGAFFLRGPLHTHFRWGNVCICPSKSARPRGEPAFFSRLTGVQHSSASGCWFDCVFAAAQATVPSKGGWECCVIVLRWVSYLHEGTMWVGKVAEPVKGEEPRAGHRVAQLPGSRGQRDFPSVSVFQCSLKELQRDFTSVSVELHSFVCAASRNFRPLGASAINQWWNV